MSDFPSALQPKVNAVSYQAPPVACERLEAILRRFGGELTRRGKIMRLDYPLPVHASTEVREFLAKHASVELTPSYLARLPGGRVYGAGNVLSPDGRMIARDVSEDFGKPFAEHWLLTYPRIRAPKAVSGATAVIATTLGAGYGHWLLEELPRLLTVDLSECAAIIAHAEAPFAREALRQIGFARTVLPARRDHQFGCELLIVPRLAGPPGYPTPEVVGLVTSFASSLRGSNVAGQGERIFISRANARRRRLANEEALWPELDARGFRRLFLEELTWQEQIAAFREARVVVAPHGAGLANLVFCKAGARVVEMFRRTYCNPCFWRLAALKGLDYRAVVAKAGEEPLRQDLRANRLDIVADVSVVLRALA